MSLGQQAPVDLEPLIRAQRRRLGWGERSALAVIVIAALCGIGLILEGTGLSARDSFLRHAAGSALVIGGLALYTACAIAATWVLSHRAHGGRLKRFAIVFVIGLVPILLLALIQDLIARLLPSGGHGAEGGGSGESPRRAPRRKGPNLASVVLDRQAAQSLLGKAVRAPRAADSSLVPRASIATCEAEQSPTRVLLYVYPRERAPRRLERNISALISPNIVRVRDHLVATVWSDDWVLRADARDDGSNPRAEAAIIALANRALASLTPH